VTPLARLGEVADVVAGVGFPKEMQGREDAEVPVFKVGDISAAWTNAQRLLRSSRNYLTLDEAASLGRLVPAGSTVFAKIGEALRLNRRAVLAQASLVDNNVMGLVPRPDVLSPMYLFYFMQTVDLGKLSRATAVPSIRKSDVVDIPVPVPTLAQQEVIVAEIEKQFSRLDEAVANLKRVKANLKRYKAAVFKAAVESRLVPTEAELARRAGRGYETGAQLLQRILDERRAQWSGPRKYKEPEPPNTDLPELAEGWVCASIEQLSSLVEYGSSTKTSEDARGVPVVRMGNIHDGALSFHDMKYLPHSHGEFPKLLLAPGDLLFNRTNSADLVGKTAVFKGAPQPCSFASYLIRARLVHGCLPPFVAAYINSSYGRQWVKSVVTQQVGQANVNGTKLQALTVPLPPSAEQARIVAEVDRRLSLVREVDAEVDTNLKRAERLRQVTLQEAFAGASSAR